MRQMLFYAILVLSLSGCGLFSKQVVYVPTPIPCPKAEVPSPPEYPVITRGATPKQVIEFFLLKTALQEGYISQLLAVLGGYQ